MARRKLGRLEISSYTLYLLENAIKHSFEARRGKLYHALRALNALAMIDLSKQAVEDPFSDREYRELTWASLNGVFEKQLDDQFRFAYVSGMARRKFGDLSGVMTQLETLIPAFVDEFKQREAAHELGRKGGIVRYLLGIQEVGSVEDLLRFTQSSLFLAGHVLDECSPNAALEPRVEKLSRILPN